MLQRYDKQFICLLGGVMAKGRKSWLGEVRIPLGEQEGGSMQRKGAV